MATACCSRTICGAAFRMQMMSGTTVTNVTHWAYMHAVTPDDPRWLSLPGYPGTGIRDRIGSAHADQGRVRIEWE